jgi:hypothetical protein
MIQGYKFFQTAVGFVIIVIVAALQLVSQLCPFDFISHHIAGNYSLSRVLPSIFSVDRQLIRLENIPFHG